MAVNDAKAILNGYSPRVGWGGAQLDKADSILKSLLDQVYNDLDQVRSDIPVIDKTISIRTGTVTLDGSGSLAVTFSGLGYATDMANADYIVLPVLSGTAQADVGGKGFSINDKTTSGFTLVCEDSNATDTVDLVIIGVAA